MVVLNYTGEEINAKIVYYGPGLSGKTTNLEFIHGNMPAGTTGKMVSMKTRTDRTLFFDYLPLELGEINGYRTRFLLYTVPGQVYYNATRKLVLKGADAVVFVADSAPDKIGENIESLRNLEDNLNEHGLTLDTIPWVIQYNKRDLDDALPVTKLHERLNLLQVPAFEASATTGMGVYETFQGVAALLYNELKKRLESGEVERETESSGEAARDAAPPARQNPAAENDLGTVVDSALREVSDSPTATPGETQGGGFEPIPDSFETGEGDRPFAFDNDASNVDGDEGDIGFITDPMRRAVSGKSEPAAPTEASTHESPQDFELAEPNPPDAVPDAAAPRQSAPQPAARESATAAPPAPEPEPEAAPEPPTPATPSTARLRVPVQVPRSLLDGPLEIVLELEIED